MKKSIFATLLITVLAFTYAMGYSIALKIKNPPLTSNQTSAVQSSGDSGAASGGYGSSSGGSASSGGYGASSGGYGQ